MYTGYDSYWMYNNHRHEPELYFQKNDNDFRHSAYTDRYKQVQGKGSSNNMYNYVPHSNTVRSQQNVPNDQHRVTSTQSMLPSPACLQPYPSLLTHQYPPNQVCSAQPNSVPDSCVPHQNRVLINVQNYNPGQSINYKSSAGPVNSQESCNYKTHTSSIRVKDFSLLNNNSKNNCNSLLVGGSLISQQRRPWYLLQDSPKNQQQETSNGQVRRDGNNNGVTAMAEVNHSYQNYETTASNNYHVSNEEQYSHVYQHSSQREIQACYDNLQQGAEKSNHDFNNTNYPAAERKQSGRTVTQEADEQRRLDQGRHSVKNACNSNAFNTSESNEVNPNSQAQLVRPEPIHNDPQSPSVSTSLADTTAKSSSQSSDSEVVSFRVPVSGTAQSTTGRDQSTVASSNSDLPSTSSTPVSPTLGDFAGDEVSNQKEGFDTSEDNARSAGSEMSQLDQQEPGRVRNEENQKLRKETVEDCNTKRALDDIVIPKVENSSLEKDSLEDGNAGCPEKAKMRAIKPEVDNPDDNENTDNTEQLSDSEESELPEIENAENINSLLSENPEDKSETGPTPLNEGQQSDVVILDETETRIEPAEDGDEVDPMGEEGRCKSEINRDKLDLLIEFVKEDGRDPVEVLTIAEDDPPPTVTNPQEGKPSKSKNRRKLSKTSIVRNKNVEREMISLISYKTPKFSSVKNSSSEETRTTSGETSDCSKDSDFGEIVSKDKQPEDDAEEEEEEEEEEDDDRSPTKSTFDCSCHGKGITREERTIINIMRAFQNLKDHFCASCAFISPVESIWINIVSGELRCLSCFKKMILKAEESHGSSAKKCSAEGPNKLKAAVVRTDEEEVGNRNEEDKNVEKKPKCGGHYGPSSDGPVKEAYGRREDLKNREREEERGMCFKNSGDLKKVWNGTADKRKRETRPDKVEKPKRTKSSEERAYEKHRKKGGEDWMDYSDASRKRSNSAEEFIPRKMAVLEEDEEDMRRNRAIWPDKRISRFGSRDSCSSERSTTSEEAVEKSKKHESGKSKTRNLTEGCAEQKSHRTKDGKADHELKRKGHYLLEKPKRKSMDLEEEIDFRRVLAKNSSGKVKTDAVKNKLMEKLIDKRAEKARKNGEVKESFRSPKNHYEDKNRLEKVVSSRGKMKKRRKKTKIEMKDPPYVPPWKMSAESRKSSKIHEKDEEVESHSPEIHKKKHERPVSKKEQTTKHSRRKTTGISEKKHGGTHYKSSKQCLISKLFKGKRCFRVNRGSKYLDKDVHRKEPRRDEDRTAEKETEENRCHSQPRSMSFHRTIENNSHSRRHSGEEPTERKEPQHRTWKGPEGAPASPPESPKEDKKDKAVGGILAGIVNGTGPKSSDSESSLIIRLMKTTTQLSLRLLGET